MNLLIEVKNNLVNIVIFSQSKKLAAISFLERNDLSERILPIINKLIVKNKLKPTDIKKILVQSEMPESFTACRIIKSVAKGWNWAIQNMDNNHCK